MQKCSTSDHAQENSCPIHTCMLTWNQSHMVERRDTSARIFGKTGAYPHSAPLGPSPKKLRGNKHEEEPDMPPADASIYRAAFEASPNGLAVCALDGTLLFRNAAMLDILSRLFADPDKTLEDFLSRSLRGKFPFHPFHRENGSFCVPVDLPDGRRSHFTFTLFAERERESPSHIKLIHPIRIVSL